MYCNTDTIVIAYNVQMNENSKTTTASGLKRADIRHDVDVSENLLSIAIPKTYSKHTQIAVPYIISIYLSKLFDL